METRKSFFSQLRADLVVLWCSATTALCVGLLINQFRDCALSLTYQSKEERLERSVERLAAFSAVPSPKPSKQSLPPKLSFDEFSKFVEEQQGVILDARPDIFYRMGHVPGARSLPREDFENAYTILRQRLEFDRSLPIVVYCSGGDCEDSVLVQKSLAELGYTNVSIYEGGWNEWTDAAKPQEKTP